MGEFFLLTSLTDSFGTNVMWNRNHEAIVFSALKTTLGSPENRVRPGFVQKQGLSGVECQLARFTAETTARSEAVVTDVAIPTPQTTVL